MIKKYSLFYSQIMQSGFIRYVFILSGASVLAQFFHIMSMPLLSRLYSPEDFGVLSLFSSIVNLLATISGFRYYLAIPLARRGRYVCAIVWLSIIAQILFVVMITLLMTMLGLPSRL